MRIEPCEEPADPVEEYADARRKLDLLRKERD
jgi:hypothetical protein